MNFKIKFLGAADTVTGSRTLVEFDGARILVDCGLFQGSKDFRQRNWQPFPIPPSSLERVILTHAHLDHTGYLPRLCVNGYKGPILCSDGTADLTRIILTDAAYLEEEFAAFANASGYSNHKPAEPLFTKEDAEQAISQLEPQNRYDWITLSQNLSVRFLRAGHIIGASFVQFNLQQEQRSCKLTFSGDLGNNRSFVLKGPEQLIDTDILVLESTYGDRMQPRSDVLAELATIAKRTFDRGGVLVIPAFAVGRAQEMTYLFRLMEDRKMIPKVPVILDSPMATAAMGVCLKHDDDQVLDSPFLGPGDNFRPAKFEVTETPDESMVACMKDGPMVVISSSGMLNGGRILHHLKHRLKDKKNTILFTGYQAEGTKGRFLQENASTLESLRIHHQEIPLEAEIVTMDALSSHADYEDTLEWIEMIERKPRLILLNHGNPKAQLALAERITERFGIRTITSSTKQDFDLADWWKQ